MSCTDKYLAILKDDERLIKLYKMDSFFLNDKKTLHIDLGNYYGTSICLSNDSDMIAVAIDYDNCLRLYSLDGRPSLIKKFTKPHKNSVTQISFTNNGKFILTCCQSDEILIWNLNGELIGSCNPGQLLLYMFDLSIDSKYLVCASFMSDIRVFEIFGLDEDKITLKKYKELKGHKKSVTHVSFNTDLNIASCSKDGTFKVFSIEEQEEDVGKKDTILLLDKKKITNDQDKIYFTRMIFNNFNSF